MLRVVESNRFEELGQALAQALADVADVLTPEQRKAIAERMERHRAWSRGK